MFKWMKTSKHRHTNSPKHKNPKHTKHEKTTEEDNLRNILNNNDDTVEKDDEVAEIRPSGDETSNGDEAKENDYHEIGDVENETDTRLNNARLNSFSQRGGVYAAPPVPPHAEILPLTTPPMACMPNEATIMPKLDHSRAPMRQDAMPSGQDVQNSQNNMPNSRTIMPNSQSIMPNSRTIMPNSQSIMPNNQTIMPNNQTIMPNNQTIMPNSQTIMPSSQTIMPSSQSIMPNSQNINSQNIMPNSQYNGNNMNENRQSYYMPNNANDFTQNNSNQLPMMVNSGNPYVTNNSLNFNPTNGQLMTNNSWMLNRQILPNQSNGTDQMVNNVQNLMVNNEPSHTLHNGHSLQNEQTQFLNYRQNQAPNSNQISSYSNNCQNQTIYNGQKNVERTIQPNNAQTSTLNSNCNVLQTMINSNYQQMQFSEQQIVPNNPSQMVPDTTNGSIYNTSDRTTLKAPGTCTLPRRAMNRDAGAKIRSPSNPAATNRQPLPTQRPQQPIPPPRQDSNEIKRHSTYGESREAFQKNSVVDSRRATLGKSQNLNSNRDQLPYNEQFQTQERYMSIPDIYKNESDSNPSYFSRENESSDRYMPQNSMQRSSQLRDQDSGFDSLENSGPKSLNFISNNMENVKLSPSKSTEHIFQSDFKHNGLKDDFSDSTGRQCSSPSSESQILPSDGVYPQKIVTDSNPSQSLVKTSSNEQENLPVQVQRRYQEMLDTFLQGQKKFPEILQQNFVDLPGQEDVISKSGISNISNNPANQNGYRTRANSLNPNDFGRRSALINEKNKPEQNGLKMVLTRDSKGSQGCGGLILKTPEEGNHKAYRVNCELPTEQPSTEPLQHENTLETHKMAKVDESANSRRSHFVPYGEESTANLQRAEFGVAVSNSIQRSSSSGDCELTVRDHPSSSRYVNNDKPARRSSFSSTVGKVSEDTTNKQVNGSSTSWMEWTQQLQAYVAWVNSQLKKKSKPLISDLRRDLQSGVVIADLIHIISGETVAGVQRDLTDGAHPQTIMRDNLDRIIQFMAAKKMKMSQITSKEIIEGNLKSIMRVILALAAHYKPQSVRCPGQTTQGTDSKSIQVGTSSSEGENTNGNYLKNNSDSTLKAPSSNGETKINDSVDVDKHDVGFNPVAPDKTPNLSANRRLLGLIPTEGSATPKTLRRQPSLSGATSNLPRPCSPVYENLPRRVSSSGRWAYDSLRASHKFQWNHRHSKMESKVLDESSDDTYSLNTSLDGARVEEKKSDNAMSFWRNLQSSSFEGTNEGSREGVNGGSREVGGPSRSGSAEPSEMSDTDPLSLRYHTIHRMSGRRKLPQIPTSSPSCHGSGRSSVNRGSTPLGTEHASSPRTRLSISEEVCREPEGRSQNSSPSTSVTREGMWGVTRREEALKDVLADLKKTREQLVALKYQNSRTTSSAHSSTVRPSVAAGGEISLVREAIGALRNSFRSTDPSQHILDTLEQAISVMMEKGMTQSNCSSTQVNDVQVEGPDSQTKVIYFTDRTVTPFMSTVSKRIGSITLRDFKTVFDRAGTYRYHFKNYDPEYGMVKEEILRDEDILPGVDGKITAWVTEDHD